MAWWKWLPWKTVVRRVARAHGFLDPVALLTQLHRFAQPSEIAEPIELLRAGVQFHARGLINSRVIQHNRDWVWPNWVERQFDPTDDAFIPRAFTITHINLTGRNWTAIGLPDCPDLPLVDPRGLLTPIFDEWSLDGWVIGDDGAQLLPSRSRAAEQALVPTDDGLAVVTETAHDGLSLTSRAEVTAGADGRPRCRLVLRAQSRGDGWAVLSLRPYNPEGVVLVHEVALAGDRRGWTVDGRREIVAFDAPAERHHVSGYRAGDVFIHLRDLDDEVRGVCDIGMVTAAALFRLKAGEPREIGATIPLAASPPPLGWRAAAAGAATLSHPEPLVQRLWDAAIRTLILHSPGEVFPGPYTYKRFWFRDAAFIIHALLCAGLTARAERAIDHFPSRQTAFGYFHSQEGEWDSNGEALWIIERFCAMTGMPPKEAWRAAILSGARWIQRKRVGGGGGGGGGTPHDGLLPAGFSAEHLGPNDFYYWDDFWGVAGLEAAARLAAVLGEGKAGERFAAQARDFREAIDRSLAGVAARLGRPAMPASPYRRLDAGAIGSLAVGYPLQLWAADDPRLTDAVEWLLENCFLGDGFFQDMIHSGINPYLTLHVAQVLMRNGDDRFAALLGRVAELASPTGQWPEAIHPRTLGGCMGDGQHVWAAAEWVLMLRNCFLREEGPRLVLAGGIAPEWLAAGRPLSFGPAPTTFGGVSMRIEPGEFIKLSWRGHWHEAAPEIEVAFPGHRRLLVPPGQREVAVERSELAR